MTHLIFFGLADIHMLCTSIFKMRNIFLVMNIDPDKHKKIEERMLFSCPFNLHTSGSEFIRIQYSSLVKK
jgi:hypothetical protein